MQHKYWLRAYKNLDIFNAVTDKIEVNFKITIEGIFLMIGPTRRRASRSDEVAKLPVSLAVYKWPNVHAAIFEQVLWRGNIANKGRLIHLI